MLLTRFRFLLLTIVMSIAPMLIEAQPQKSHFRATVPVKTQTSGERKVAAQNAFMQVMLRISGFESVMRDAHVLSQAKRAQAYIEQFQYLPLESETLIEEGFEELLSLTFSRAALEDILRKAQQAIWSNRPTTLLWLVEDDPEYGRQLLNQLSDNPVVTSIDAAAERRGLPLIYPLLDLDDQLALSIDDVWNIDEKAIARASDRYGADVILVGRYSQTSRGELWSTWQFFHADTDVSYDSRLAVEEEGSIDNLGRDALDPLADFLAKRYAIQPQLETGGRLVVQVSGIRDFGAYRRSLDYLEGLGAVSDLRLGAVRQDTMLLYLESEAGIDTFMKLLTLDDKLQPERASDPIGPAWQQAPQGTMENPLRFTWPS